MSRVTKVGLRLLVLAGVSVVWSSSPPTARGQEPQRPATPASLESRVRELEETIRQMQANAVPGVLPGATLAPAPQGRQPALEYPSLPTESGTTPAPLESSTGSSSGSSGGESGKGGDGKTESPVLAGWDDGFFLRSKNRDYQLRITGQIQADYREFLKVPNDPLEVDTFLLRRARFGLEADMFKYYEFRFLPDFGQGNAVVQDCYMNVHYVDWLQFETGKFKQPFSYEQLIQDRFIPTCERSLIDQLVPARDVGVMVHGQKLLGNRFDYYAAVSNGEINGNFDNNENKDLNGRLVVRPFAGDEFIPLVRLFQVGISGSIGVEQEAIMPASLKTPATVTWFQFNTGVRADGRRERWSPELSYFFKGFGCAAQYFRMEQNLRPALTGPSSAFVQSVPFEGYYVLATYLLTGEERTTYSAAVTPLRPFDPCHPFACPGAWELIARVSHLEVGDTVFAPGLRRLADPTRWSDAAIESTLGFNWYFNKWVRMQFNWEHAQFHDHVVISNVPRTWTDSLITRFQVIF